jgi:hypothetical protein
MVLPELLVIVTSSSCRLPIAVFQKPEEGVMVICEDNA